AGAGDRLYPGRRVGRGDAEGGADPEEILGSPRKKASVAQGRGRLNPLVIPDLIRDPPSLSRPARSGWDWHHAIPFRGGFSGTCGSLGWSIAAYGSEVAAHRR